MIFFGAIVQFLLATNTTCTNLVFSQVLLFHSVWYDLYYTALYAGVVIHKGKSRRHELPAQPTNVQSNVIKPSFLIATNLV